MSQMSEPDPADVEYTDFQLYPGEPPVATDQLADEVQLPYDLVGADPEPVLVRVAERFGLPQRILVAPGGDESDGAYQVLEDARWVQAAREAGIGKVPVRVLDVQGLSADLLVLILNQQRPANVAAQADALERLLAAGIPDGELARASGMTRGRIRRLAGLLELDPDLRQALREDRIKAQVAFTAAELAGDVQATLAATLEREGQLTGADVKRVREQMGTGEGSETAQEEGDGRAEIGRLLQELSGEDPAERARRQARELLQTLDEADLAPGLRVRLAELLEEIEQVHA